MTYICNLLLQVSRLGGDPDDLLPVEAFAVAEASVSASPSPSHFPAISRMNSAIPNAKVVPVKEHQMLSPSPSSSSSAPLSFTASTDKCEGHEDDASAFSHSADTLYPQPTPMTYPPYPPSTESGTAVIIPY